MVGWLVVAAATAGAGDVAKAQAHTPSVCPGVPPSLALDTQNLGEDFDIEPLDTVLNQDDAEGVYNSYQFSIFIY